MVERKILKNKIYLYLTEFFAGMSVMAVELGASRLLAPYFSSSQIVWTIIIGTFVPTFISIPAVGTSITFLIFAGILLALCIVYFVTSKINFKQAQRVPISIVILLICILFGHNNSFAFWENDLTFEGESIYNYLQVKENDREVILSTNVLFCVQSIYKKDKELTGMYYDYAMAAPYMAGINEKKKYSDEFKIRLAEESINKLTLNHSYFPRITCKTIYNLVCDLYDDLEYSDINCPAIKDVLRKYQEERNQNIDISNWAPYTKPAALETFDAKEFYLLHQNDMEKALIGLGEQINGLLNQYAATQNKCKQITKELDANKKDAMKTEKQIRIEQKQLRSENRELKEELKRYKKEFEELELAAAQMVLADSNQANLIIEDNEMARAKTYLGTNFEQRKKNNLKLLRREENG